VVVDGVQITDLAALKARAEKIEDYQPTKPAQLIDQKAEWIADKMTKPKSKLMKKLLGWQTRFMATRIGQRIDKLVKANPERVSAEKSIEIRFKDGRVETKKVTVVDVGRSAMLERYSIGVEAAGMIPGIPFAGIIIPAAATLASLIGAGAMFIKRDRDMTNVWFAMAKKHALTGLTKTGTLALVEDLKDVDELRQK
jgi:hypothetical protein